MATIGCPASLVVGLLSARLAMADARPVDFTREIEPIFKEFCHPCHGPQRQKGGLRLDARALAFTAGDSGKPAMTPGNAADSRLVKLLLEPAAENRMPQKGPPLAPEKIALVRAWIDQGAPWPAQPGIAESVRHWAYVKPVRPATPPTNKRDWARTPVDAFILSRLEAQGLTPSPEASRETLIRRVSLDLTGLPPTPEDVDAFLADRSRGAYEKVVDRLLASPHYGERWARPWLDLARYADTNGHLRDDRRSNWKFRDWVIHSLNVDMPFDQFTIEQIAGDMVPNATVEQRVATGFHRNCTFNQELSDVDPKEALWEMLVDRVGTTAAAWLGTTLACAQCHDHKYDPFTQKDYYRLLAFFDNAKEAELEFPTPEQAARRDEIVAEIAKLQATLRTSTPELEAAQSRWERALLADFDSSKALTPIRFSTSGGGPLSVQPDGSFLAGGTAVEKASYEIEAAVTARAAITGIRLDVLPDTSLPGGGPGRGGEGNFVLSEIRMRATGDAASPVAFRKASADFSQDGWLVDQAIDGNVETGWALAPRTGAAHVAVFELKTPLEVEAGQVLHLTLAFQSRRPRHLLGRFRLSVTTNQQPGRLLDFSEAVRATLRKAAAARTPADQDQIAAAHRASTPLLDPVRERIGKLRQEIANLHVPTTLVLDELPGFERPSTHVHVRGSFLARGERVFAGVPAALNRLDERFMANRLGFARWLTDKDNPLTARVTVNRFWAQLFGRGIVETVEDFGTQGAAPSHPQLLDWLATEFVRQKWSPKAIHRLIVTSAVYRQSSRISPAALERDPQNRWLARGPRFRMEAEMIRDSALAAGGLLSRRLGGPSVFPAQPEGIWRIANSSDQWLPSEGGDRFRRSIYTFWRRTAPYPSLVTFDAPSRETCTARRVLTNTPLQALTVLNDPAFFAAARALARRMVAEAPPGARARATRGFRLALARRPKQAEVRRLLALFRESAAFYAANSEAARQVVGDVKKTETRAVAEQAAWTLVANVILSLDETLTKE